MTGARFLAAFLGLPLVGAGVVLSKRFRWMPAGAALATAAAVGAVSLCAEMLVLTVAGVRWSVWLLLLPPAAAIAASLRGPSEQASRPPVDPSRPWTALLLSLAVAAVLTVAYAALTARVTSSDLLLFWGTKGEHFGLAGRIDAEFLGRPDRQLLHSDYPPLWPALYGFATLLAGRFAWGASLATLPSFLGLSVVAVWSFARPRIGALEASGFAAAFASIFGFLLSDCLTAGNADAPLLFFETLALCLLVFAREERGAFLLAGIALAGAAWIKLEGIAFGWAVIACAAILVRPISLRNLLRLSVPPVAAYLAWVAYCRAHGLLATLGPQRLVLTGERFRTIASGMISAASMRCLYVPWIVVGLLFLIRRPGGVAKLPVVVAALVAGFDCGFYLASTGDPTVWITLAGERTLITPLLALLVAAMAPAGAHATPAMRHA